MKCAGNNRGGKAIIQGRAWRQLWPYSTKVDSAPFQQPCRPDCPSTASCLSQTVSLHSLRALMTSTTPKRKGRAGSSLLWADLGACAGCSQPALLLTQSFIWLAFPLLRSQLKYHPFKRPSRTFSGKYQSLLQLYLPCFLFATHLNHLLIHLFCLHILIYLFFRLTVCLHSLDISPIQTGALTKV